MSPSIDPSGTPRFVLGLFQFSFWNAKRRQVYTKCFLKRVNNLMEFRHLAFVPRGRWVTLQRLKPRQGKDLFVGDVHGIYATPSVRSLMG